jgi:hypothetical protein
MRLTVHSQLFPSLACWRETGCLPAVARREPLVGLPIARWPASDARRACLGSPAG